MSYSDPLYGDPPPPPPPPAWEPEGWQEWPYPRQPVWPSPYTWEPTPPPSRRRSLVSLLLLVVLVGILGGGAAVAFHSLAQSPAPSGSTAAVVDVYSDLGNGDSAAGTGMILDANGTVLTNNHVIDGALHVTVTLTSDGATSQAQVVGADPTDDVAVLRMNGASGLPTIPVGDSSKLQVGDSVTVVGNALGRGGPPTVSQGSVTALGQTITATDADGANPETLNGMIQFNAGIQAGDSGGPLLNGQGQAVGMDTAGSGGFRADAGTSNEGFAIPIDTAVAIAHEILSGSASPNIVQGNGPLLGVEVQDSSSPSGALVVQVVPGTPADNAGIEPQDVITSVNGSAVSSAADLRSDLRRHHPGDAVRIGWVDVDGQTQHATVRLATAPPQ